VIHRAATTVPSDDDAAEALAAGVRRINANMRQVCGSMTATKWCAAKHTSPCGAAALPAPADDTTRDQCSDEGSRLTPADK
jgi:hypothetical protein